MIILFIYSIMLNLVCCVVSCNRSSVKRRCYSDNHPTPIINTLLAASVLPSLPLLSDGLPLKPTSLPPNIVRLPLTRTLFFVAGGPASGKTTFFLILLIY